MPVAPSFRSSIVFVVCGVCSPLAVLLPVTLFGRMVQSPALQCKNLIMYPILFFFHLPPPPFSQSQSLPPFFFFQAPPFFILLSPPLPSSLSQSLYEKSSKEQRLIWCQDYLPHFIFLPFATTTLLPVPVLAPVLLLPGATLLHLVVTTAAAFIVVVPVTLKLRVVSVSNTIKKLRVTTDQ